MWQRFSDSARKAIALAEGEAEKSEKMVTSTEHMLLGLVREPSTASLVLTELGVGIDAIEAEIAKLPPDPVGKKPRAKMILSRDAKRAIDATYQEALKMEAKIIGTEHVLLGLIGQGGAASIILASLGVDMEKARKAVQAMTRVNSEDLPVA